MVLFPEKGEEEIKIDIVIYIYTLSLFFIVSTMSEQTFLGKLVLLKTLARKHITHTIFKFSSSCGEVFYLTPFPV